MFWGESVPLLWSLLLRPAGLGPAGRPSASWRSKTWPFGFAQAGQSRGPGTGRPSSSSRALLPRPRVMPGGDTYATRPEVRVRWGYRCRVVCPLGATPRQGGPRAAGPARTARPGLLSPLGSPLTSAPSPRVTGHRGGCFSPRALHVVPDSERLLRAVLDDSRFAPSESAPVKRLGPRPVFARLQASGANPGHHGAILGPEASLGADPFRFNF